MKPCRASRWKMQAAVACCVLLFCMAPAFALWSVATVTPDSTRENGATVQTERHKDETLTFTVTRYLNKDTRVAANEIGEITRRATLEVRDKTSLLASADVSATPIEGALVYKFTLSPTCALYSKFALYERGERELGGVVYDLNIPACAAFVQRKAPEHP